MTGQTETNARNTRDRDMGGVVCAKSAGHNTTHRQKCKHRQMSATTTTTLICDTIFFAKARHDDDDDDDDDEL